MANVIIPQRFWLRRGTASALTSANEVLYAGEVCCETDTGRAKIGDGVTDWVTLGYAVPGRINLAALSDGDSLVWDASAEEWVAEPPSGSGGNGAIGATFDGGGVVLTPGVFTDVFVPFNCTIVGATLLADTTGNLVVSVLTDPYASFPPTTDLAPTTPPTITAATKSQDTTLSGWSTAITAGDVVRLGVVSCSSITRATLSLEVTKP